MKLTEKQVRRIIREELAKESRDGRMLPSQVVKKPAPHGYDRAGFPRTEPAPDEDVKGITDELVRALKNGRVSPERGANGEIYIMTGAAEGITVKVLRRGR